MTAAAMSKPHSSARRGGALKLHRGATFGEVSTALHQPQKPSFAPIADHGTVFAIDNSSLGVAALFPRSANRGGARNYANRESHALTLAQVARLKAAERHSRQIGLPFTRMITIHWEAAGMPLESMAAATGRFTDLLAKALARHGSPVAWLWVHENGEGKGGHCHLLAHVPPALVGVVTGLQRGWLRRISGNRYRARVIHSRPIGGKLGLESGNRELHAINLELAFAYILKGAEPKAALRFGLDRLEPGGRIIGKRCGTSQNIGQKARKGWQSK